MQIILSILLGVSLSAAAGFRIFVPFLVMSMAGRAGFLTLSPEFAWLTSTPALIILIVATILEILAFYIPVVDNFLDLIAVPAAAIAGTVLTASVITDISPMFKWTLAIIAGGGVATAIHGVTTALRGASTVMTAGLGNNVVSSAENVSSTSISILALFSPILAIILLLVIIYSILKLRKRRKRAKTTINREDDIVIIDEEGSSE